MKHKTWFRLVVKGIGIYIFCEGVIHGFGFVFTVLIDSVIAPGNHIRFFSTSYASNSLGRMIIGAYLFFAGEWIINLAIPSNRAYCPNCGYDLSKRVGAHCPECGVALASEPSAPTEGLG